MRWNRRKPGGRRRVVQQQIPQLSDKALLRDGYKQVRLHEHEVDRRQVVDVKEDPAFAVDGTVKRPRRHAI